MVNSAKTLKVISEVIKALNPRSSIFAIDLSDKGSGSMLIGNADDIASEIVRMLATEMVFNQQFAFKCAEAIVERLNAMFGLGWRKDE